ncbi:putative calcium-transporting ATPase 9, plasma membrane-type isoform X2 [Wolffia australiana]
MENRLLKNFDVPAKNAPEEALSKWRKLAWLVKNPTRRYRYIADLEKRRDAEDKRRKFQEKLRVFLYVQRAAFRFIDAATPRGEGEYNLSEEAIKAQFLIHPDELASVVGKHDVKGLRRLGHLDGICRKIRSSTSEGITTDDLPVRQKIFGFNQYEEKPSRSFLGFVFDAMRDLTLIILIICAVVSITVGIATEGWPKGMYDGLGIVLSIFLVVGVTATSDYQQSLQFRDLDKEKKKIPVQVTRDSCRQTICIHDLVVGDLVHLSIGDQVPADGLFVSGYSLFIDESSLTGESEPVNISMQRPFLLGGTKVQDGSAKMLVTSVGMRTEWGRLTDTLNQGGEDETPLQVKLNGVATIIGKIGLGFAVLTFLVLLGRLVVGKAIHGVFFHWSVDDALLVLDYLAIAVTIVVVAVPEGLPLAVTLSLAFAMKKLMNDKALVRHLSACETMGSVTSICTDKTGTLTTNHMEVNKIWICDTEKVVSKASEDLSSVMSEEVLKILIQCIFQNTSSDISTNKDGRKSILGSPTEKALLEFALRLGGDFDARFQECEVVKVEPFNSTKKRMSVLISLKNGGLRAFCKGASESILKTCDTYVDNTGNSLPLSEKKHMEIMDVINSFASEALRTLCIAFKDVEKISSDNDIPTDGYTLVAIVGIKDPVRPGVKEAVQNCISAGITVRMVTGDNINTAKAIAKECGILTDDGLAVEGPEFSGKNDSERAELIPRIQVMARSSPTDKHLLVNNLKKMCGEVVAVTGDGTNDAPALREADIGLAMGTGTEFQLTVNIVALILNFVSACITGSTPLTAVQLLWVNMIMDTLGALALATEPPNDEMMRKPPVPRGADFITLIMWRNILGQVIYQLAVLGVFMFDGKRLLNLSGLDATSTLNTFIFNTFVFCQVFNEINSLEMESINVFRGIFRSWLFVAIVASTIVFQVIIVQFLGTLANTVPLSWQLWLSSVLIGSVSMIVAVVLKFIPIKREGISVGDGNGYLPLPNGPDEV